MRAELRQTDILTIQNDTCAAGRGISVSSMSVTEQLPPSTRTDDKIGDDRKSLRTVVLSQVHGRLITGSNGSSMEKWSLAMSAKIRGAANTVATILQLAERRCRTRLTRQLEIMGTLYHRWYTGQEMHTAMKKRIVADSGEGSMWAANISTDSDSMSHCRTHNRGSVGYPSPTDLSHTATKRWHTIMVSQQSHLEVLRHGKSNAVTRLLCDGDPHNRALHARNS